MMALSRQDNRIAMGGGDHPREERTKVDVCVDGHITSLDLEGIGHFF